MTKSLQDAHLVHVYCSVGNQIENGVVLLFDYFVLFVSSSILITMALDYLVCMAFI